MKELSNVYQDRLEKLQLSKALVLQKNRGRSTAMSEKEFRWIIQSIEYALAHGTETSFLPCYESGVQQLQRMVEDTKKASIDALAKRMPIKNERYLSILDQQLPDFFKRYDPIYHATYCKEDLDYPLIDGLPLEHNMYHKQGIDLVSEYFHRYQIEEDFLHHYPDVLEFLEYYERHVGIDLEELGVNVCEVVLTQALFASLLSLDTLRISEAQAAFIEEKLSLLVDVEGFLITLFHQLTHCFSLEVQTYLQQARPLIQIRLCNAIQTHTIKELIVTPRTKKETHFQMQSACDPFLFQQLLQQLSKITPGRNRITLVLETPLGFQDYLDLLEMDLLFEEELILLFDQLQDIALVLLCSSQFGSQFHFHRRFTFEKLDALECSFPWEQTLLSYLSQMPTTRKEHFLSLWQSL